MNSLNILVVIPVYNCQKQALRVLGEFTPNILEKISLIIFLDNRSSDATVSSLLQRVKELGQNKVKVCINTKNYNLGGSQKIGFNQAQESEFDYVAILHGDNQARNEDLLKLINIAERNPGFDAIMGSRFMPGSKRLGYSLLRTMGNIGINAIYSIFTGRIIWDLGSGINLYKVNALECVNYLSCDDGLTFNMDLLLELIRERLKIKYVPITWREEDQVSNAKIFNVGLKSLKAIVKWRLGHKLPQNNKSYSTVEAV